MQAGTLTFIMTLIICSLGFASVENFNSMIEQDIIAQQEMNKQIIENLENNNDLKNYDSLTQVFRKKKRTVIVKVQIESTGPAIVLR